MDTKVVLELLKKTGVNSTHFVTLVYRKGVNENDCIKGYDKFLIMLNRRIYGRRGHRGKIKIKQLGFLETNFRGYFGVHILLDLNDFDKDGIDRYKKQIKDLWKNYIKVGGRKIGTGVCFRNDMEKWRKDSWEYRVKVGRELGDLEIEQGLKHVRVRDYRGSVGYEGKYVTGWFIEIYDLNGVIGYVTKHFGKKDRVTGSDKCMLVGHELWNKQLDGLWC